MGLERRRNRLYYYSKERVGGRVLSRYVGSGLSGFAFAALASETAEEQRLEREGVRKREAEFRRLNLEINAFCAEVDRVLAETLEREGYFRHNRGEWRKKRTK